ncbi:MAG: hypothetical protein EOO29_21255 [Comamonadaceae bacterium]|nr:MAG: hypothetical protein EOO29_21255 [Comamonadaceae bacterium]
MKKQAPQHTTATEARSGMAEAGRKPTPLQAQVLLAARRRCDDMGDGQAARDQMKHEVLETPAELLPDLLSALSTVRITHTDLFHPTTTNRKECNP